MLLDRATLLVERARQHQAKAALAKEAKGFETRAKSIAAPTQDLLQVYNLAKELRSAGLETDLATGPASALAEQARTLLAKFAVDPKFILAGDETITHVFLPALKKITTDHRARLLSAWQEFVDAQFTPLPESVLKALSTIAAYRHLVDAIRRRHNEVLAMRAKLPLLGSVSVAIHNVTTSAAGIDSSLRELIGGGIPAEVVEFLSQAGTTGFNLAQLTPVIDTWLRERGLLSAFRIRSA